MVRGGRKTRWVHDTCVTLETCASLPARSVTENFPAIQGYQVFLFYIYLFFAELILDPESLVARWTG